MCIKLQKCIVGQLFEMGLTWAKIKVFVELLFWRWDWGLHFLAHSAVYRIQFFAIEGSWSHLLAVGREPFPYSRGWLHSLTDPLPSSKPAVQQLLSSPIPISVLSESAALASLVATLDTSA